MAQRFDIAIAGGGLAGSLIALALASRRPDLSVALVEAGESFGGNHVWSFFESDIAEADRDIIEPLIGARWDAGYDVRFPGLTRSLPTPYRSITSQRLDAALRAALPAEALHRGNAVTALEPRAVVLAGGARIEADGVIDARGVAAAQYAHLSGGWQKFLGQMLRTAAPHRLTRPVVMDATVEQVDGYRFVYCLPFSETEVFVEDTYYSDCPDLDRAALARRIDDYAAQQGWQVVEVSREETGVLPVVTDGDFGRFHAAGATEGVVSCGVRAGLFQPLTSYSLPDAVRFACFLASIPDLPGPDFADLAEWHWRHWRGRGFYRMLARMLFGAAEPGERYKVLERFYGLDAGLIERFYAGRSTFADKVRVLAGKPPVPIGRAAAVLAGLGAPPSLARAPEGPA